MLLTLELAKNWVIPHHRHTTLMAETNDLRRILRRRGLDLINVEETPESETEFTLSTVRHLYEPYTRYLADLMGLRDWRIFHAEFNPERDTANYSTDEVTLAYVIPEPQHRWATLHLNPQYVFATEEEFRHTLVHELTHVHVSELHGEICSTIDHYTSAAYTEQAYYYQYHRLERAVEGIAVPWSERLPTLTDWVTGSIA